MIPFLLFFLSGASALIYEVAWVRQFGLVFGGFHLAVTTVLSVVMGDWSVFADLEKVYQEEATKAKGQGRQIPESNVTLGSMKAVTERRTRENRGT